jgi:hypothetical protein
MNNIGFLVLVATVVEPFLNRTVSVAVLDRFNLFYVFDLDRVHHFNVEAATLDVIDRLVLILKRATQDLLLAPCCSHPPYLL